MSSFQTHVTDGLNAVAQSFKDLRSSVNSKVSLVESIEGLPMMVYGASYEGADLQNTGPNTRWINRASRRLGFSVTNRAVSGDESTEMFWHMQQPLAPRRLAPGTKGLFLIPGLLNDTLRNPTGQWRKETYKNNMKSCIYRIMCQSVIPFNDPSISYSSSGTIPSSDWTAQSLAVAAGYNMQFESTTRANASATINLPVGTDFVFFTALLAVQQYGGAGPAFSVTVDGTSKLSHYQPPASYKSGTSSAWTASGMCVPLVNLANTTHTMVVTSDGTGGASPMFVFLDIGVIDRTKLPQLLISRGPMFNPAKPPAGGTNADVTTYRGYLDEVLSEIYTESPWMQSAITVFDPLDYGWDATIDIGFDNLHPNDKGQAVLADALVGALSPLPFRQGMTTAGR